MLMRRPLLILLLSALALLGLAWPTRPNGYLHVFFLDTRGDAILIQSPRGEHVLIDGGADPVRLALHLGRRLPFWKRTLDAVILTRGDNQRLPGQVAALARYRANLALKPLVLPAHNASASATAYAAEWKRLLAAEQTPVRTAQPGDRLALGGATLTILTSSTGIDPRVNRTSGLVMRLDYGATSILLGGACDPTDETALLATVPPVTVLAYPWERKMNTTVLDTWQPRAIIFTTAYQHQPHARQTLYARAGGNDTRYPHLYHPALDGSIELVSDGVTTRIRPERGRAGRHE